MYYIAAVAENDVIVTLRLSAAMAADVDRVRGAVKRGSWVKTLIADAIVAHDGLAMPAEPARQVEDPPAAQQRTEIPLPKIARRHWA